MLFTAAAALNASGAEHLHLLNEIPKNLFLSRSATGSGARMPQTGACRVPGTY